MTVVKKITTAAAAILIFSFSVLHALPAAAQDLYLNSSQGMPYSYVLMEGTTGTLLYAENGNEPFIPFHASKLMTLLLLCEAMDRSELSLDSVITVSKNANSQQGAQVWLDVGEQILLDELVSAITVGNANDACVAIAEAVAGTEEDFVRQMNEKAAELGMTLTHYADSTGAGEGSITTAADTAILASALSKYDWLKEYMTTWMTTIRGGKAQLVSTNRLIRSYSGITGMKAYYHEECGNCLIASAERNGMSMICVIFGEPNEYQRFTTAKEKMNIGFSAYSIYKPKRTDVILQSVNVKGGVDDSVDTDAADMGCFVIRSGREEDIEIVTEYFDDVAAPVEAGQRVGRIVYMLDDEEVYASDIVATSSVKKMNMFYALLKTFCAVFAS